MSYHPQNNNNQSYRTDQHNSLNPQYGSAPQYGVSSQYNLSNQFRVDVSNPQYGLNPPHLNTNPSQNLDSPIRYGQYTPQNNSPPQNLDSPLWTPQNNSPIRYGQYTSHNNSPPQNLDSPLWTPQNNNVEYTHNGVLRKKKFETVMETQTVHEQIMVMVKQEIQEPVTVTVLKENGKYGTEVVMVVREIDVQMPQLVTREIQVPRQVEVYE